MDAMYTNEMFNILKSYLSHVTYIDDEFKIAWQEEETEEIKRPKRFDTYVKKETEGDTSHIVEPRNRDGLFDFCIYMQKNYPDITIIPIPYSVDISESTLQTYIDYAKLLVLDWELESGASKTAVDVIKKSNFYNLFKLCVIYTSNLEDAIKDFRQKMGYDESRIKTGGGQDRRFFYIRDNANLFMICGKKDYDFNGIIREFTNLFIKEIGYFSISFIELFSRLEKKIPQYLNDFKEPFDSLFFLQSISDKMPLIELCCEFDNMVFNTLKEELSLNENILRAIYNQKVNDLRALIGDSDNFNNRLWFTLDRICKSIKGCSDGINILKQIDVQEYKQYIEEVICDPDQLYVCIQKVGEKFAEKYFSLKYEDAISKIDNLTKEQRAEILKRYRMAEYRQIKEKIVDAIPIFLIMILDPEKAWNQTLHKLVCMLKVHKYDETKSKFKDIFTNCYVEREDGNFELKKKSSKNRNWELVWNKIKQGDVFIKYDPNGKREFEEIYLCIMPRCHTLRPEKIDGKLQLIKGIIKTTMPDRKSMRQSEHLTILPDPLIDSNIMYVKWQFHNIVTIDLQYIEKSLYDNINRIYRLGDDYLRQIMGEFNAFYSKVGVEEVFAKNNMVFAEITTKSIV